MCSHTIVHKQTETNVLSPTLPQLFSNKLTKSPAVVVDGTHMFISEDLAVTISAFSEALLRYTWQPSVLSMETVGHAPLIYGSESKEGRRWWRIGEEVMEKRGGGDGEERRRRLDEGWDEEGEAKVWLDYSSHPMSMAFHYRQWPGYITQLASSTYYGIPLGMCPILNTI